MSRGKIWTMGLLAAATLAVAPAVAQDAQNSAKDRLSLVVRGKATSPADEVSIDLTVSASAEEATEAEKKYRDKLNRVLNALGKGDGKSTDDGDSPKKHKKKKKDDDSEDSSSSPTKKAKKPADDDEGDAPKKKKAKKPADDDEGDAPKKATKPKKPADDEDEDAPKKATKPKKPADDDDDDAPKKPAKKDEPKKDDAPKKDETKKDDASKKDEHKKDDASKKDEPEAAEKFPFVVEVKEGGLTFGVKGSNPQMQQWRRNMGQPQGKEEPEFRFSSSLSIVFKSVAKAEPKALRKRIAEILDKVSEAGVDTSTGTEGDGTPPTVHFAVTDVDEIKKKAYEDGMGAARRRAGNLASLSDRVLGKVVTVRDQTALPAGGRRAVSQPQYYGYGYNVQPQGAPDGDWSTEVVAEVDLYVEFELKDRGPNDPPTKDKK